MAAADRPGPAKRRNHALWLGPLAVLVGSLSYFMLFARWAALRDVPWVNLPIVLGGVVLSAIGTRRALGRTSGLRGKLWPLCSITLSAGLGALFVAYVFVLSYMLPPPSAATLALGEAPDFALADQHGRNVRLSELRGRKVVITFYRGHW